MKKSAIVIVTVFILLGQSCNTSTEKKQENMESDKKELNAIFPKGKKGSEEWFTGNAYPIGLAEIDSIYTTLAGNVYFEPGARSY